MTEITRLGLLKSSAKAIAGATAVSAIATSAADAEAGHVGTDPVVAYVKNPRKGELTVMSGDREVTVRDRALAARIARAADR